MTVGEIQHPLAWFLAVNIGYITLLGFSSMLFSHWIEFLVRKGWIGKLLIETVSFSVLVCVIIFLPFLALFMVPEWGYGSQW